ncbi:MAG: hypothetical protein K2J84_06335, partial [Bacteroidaceae bacterium]|nr:hypothetical protein [Bacteroidaceae bacterium]
PYLCQVIPLPKALHGAEAGRHITYIKAYLALWFWRFLNLASSFIGQKTKQRERLMGVLYTFLSLAHGYFV